MKLHFVNHASFIAASGSIRLLSDPWLSARAFNDSWALLHPRPDLSLDGVTHVWFSHEHPDHFSPRDLQNIPEEHRERITILYQHTRDRRVVDFCKKIGFKDVQELEPTWTSLAPDFEVLCAPFDGVDSWMCIRTPGATVLNVNDCTIENAEQARAIAERVGSVDVLMTQFSYASWSGDTAEERRATARRVLERLRFQSRALSAPAVLPFASFAWFCHEENFHMNDSVNRIDEVEAFIRDETEATPIVMYPGDVWRVGEAWDSFRAVERHLSDYARVIDASQLQKSRKVEPAELMNASRSFVNSLFAGESRLLVRAYLVNVGRQSRMRWMKGKSARAWLGLATSLLRLRVEPANIHVQDHGRSYALDLSGLRATERAAEACDISLSSESLLYCFTSSWGSDALEVNSRFRCPSPDPRQRSEFFKFFEPARRRSMGYAPLTWRSLLGAVQRALLGS